MLVYCLPCRQNHEEKIDVDIPLGMVNRSLFLDLYRTGKTRSDPFTATELVFGRADPELVSQAQQLLATSRL
ncbi:hypothetical protein A11A3_15704 [Alcanivorax hongdengensis A-11-3]|uniref:Uncharacterized protein n=2 Tax=Alcanivorax hongdengensis TaxID=519051 RepID=L0WBB3_9GAMM|nr:hypothetical protein A11A3_15704 [Alcanivorax hongdengensis A-11-3]